MERLASSVDPVDGVSVSVWVGAAAPALQGLARSGGMTLTEFQPLDARRRFFAERSVDLRGANLRGATLIDANLRGADLIGADLGCADLYGADLRRANLGSANLRGADLRCANLRCANLRHANLYGADLSYADLRGATLIDANLRGVLRKDTDPPIPGWTVLWGRLHSEATIRRYGNDWVP